MDEKLKNIIMEYKSLPNKDLEFALSKISEDFEETKSLIIKLTLHLDSLEKHHTNILNEYKSRKK